MGWESCRESQEERGCHPSRERGVDSRNGASCLVWSFCVLSLSYGRGEFVIGGGCSGKDPDWRGMRRRRSGDEENEER